MIAMRQRGRLIDLRLRTVRLRGFTALPNAPFYRVNCYPRAEVYIDPIAGIGLLTWEFESCNRPFFRDTQLNLLIARHRRNRMPMVQMNVVSKFVDCLIHTFNRVANTQQGRCF
jgi:hypothetical protein